MLKKFPLSGAPAVESRMIVTLTHDRILTSNPE